MVKVCGLLFIEHSVLHTVYFTLRAVPHISHHNGHPGTRISLLFVCLTIQCIFLDEANSSRFINEPGPTIGVPKKNAEVLPV